MNDPGLHFNRFPFPCAHRRPFHGAGQLVTAAILAGLATWLPRNAAADPAVVINEFKNSATDVVELLVISNNLNMQGMLLKDYTSSGAGDGGGAYTFKSVPLWSAVPAGALVVLRNDTSAADVSAGGGDYNLDVGLKNTNYFTVAAGGFDIASSEIVQIKHAGSGTADTTGAIHTFASTTATALYFTNSPSPRLRATSGSSGTDKAVAANTSNQSINDYDGSDATGNLSADTLGTWNNTNNEAFILALRSGASSAPALQAPLGPTVLLADTLSFVVTATDPDGTDAVTLWATNLPSGATFDATTSVAVASNVFTWVSAGPLGNYTPTFYAADKDGTNRLTITIAVRLPGVASGLIISEYGEGSSYNKYIELFNGTAASVDLGAYSLRESVNGTNIFSNPLPLAGTLAQNHTFVVANSRAPSATLQAKANLLTSSSCLNFNGNDPIGLFQDTNLVDIVGEVGVDNNFGVDTTLVRKSSIVAPSTNYDAGEWDAYPIDTWGNLGLHTMDGMPAQSDYPPVLGSVAPQFVALGATLQFGVSAVDSVDGDTITLSATSLPAGASFPTVTSAASVSGTFTWVNANPIGVYTSRFAAVDKDGTNALSVVLTVSPAPPTNQSVIVHINEVVYNDAGSDDGEFVELVARSGQNLSGCKLRHYNGNDTQDGGVWTFTFPSFVVPDDGVSDTNGQALGFVLLAQADGVWSNNADFLLPNDTSTTNHPIPSLQNGPDGLVLFDPAGVVLDAVVWGTPGSPTDTGDLLVDDPGPTVLTQSGDPRAPNYLHTLPTTSGSDNSCQAPDNVIGDTGANWTILFPSTPGTTNAIQTSGNLVLARQAVPPPSQPTGILLTVH